MGLTKCVPYPIIQIISDSKAEKRRSSFRKERTESSRQMRGARVTGREYISELRPKQFYSVGGDGVANVILAGVCWYSMRQTVRVVCE